MATSLSAPTPHIVRLISWNIQWCRGIDGRVDPQRIAREARKRYDPDVCCFQEVAVNYPDLDASGDQPALLAAAFAGYSCHFAAAVDTPDGERGRKQFGNMLLSRLPVRQVFRHSLPWPPDPGVPNMPRVALEAVIEAPFGLVGVTTTHLEYYSNAQRAAQVERLRELKAEALAHCNAPSAAKKKDTGPFTPFPRALGAILAGDFNMRPGDPLVARLLQTYSDAWTVANPGKPHAPTFGLHDKEFAGEPYCCDFVFASKDLEKRIRAVRVDTETKASDHQPVIVEFRP
jgi:endonuclease/exonuclease/phosphatase family metal-dependent hydrolase